jgi:hypothetical protein
MALANYAGLQAEIMDWSTRGGLDDAKAPTFIALAEARLNRELGAVETDATLTGAIGSRELNISTLSVVQPIALFGRDPGGGDEWAVTNKPDGSFPYLEDTGRPTIWARDGAKIDLNRPCDQSYTFRLRYRQRFALSDAQPTNWLLTEHPDVYLAASLLWGAGYNEDWANGAAWKMTLEQAIPSIRHTIAENNRRGTLTVDRALVAFSHGRRGSWDGSEQ